MDAGSVAAAFLAGLSGGASFGPVNLIVLQLYMISRPLHGVSFSVGALIGDIGLILTTSYFVSALTGLFEISAISSAASVVLLGYGIFIVFSTFYPIRSAKGREFRDHSALIFLVFGITITYLSPVGIALWATLVATVRFEAAEQYLMIAMMLGSLTWFVTFNFILLLSVRVFSPLTRSLITLGSALMMITIALMRIFEGYTA